MAKEGFLDIIIDIVGTQMDFSPVETEEKVVKEKEKQPKSEVNEFGDKLGKKEICQGIILFLGSLAVVFCACARGCQEISKHKETSDKQAKITQLQNLRIK